MQQSQEEAGLSARRRHAAALQIVPLGLVCAAVLAGILVAGLWPFDSPKNQARWLEGQNGLRVGGHGTVLSMRPLSEELHPDSCTIELWVRPRAVHQNGTLLTLYDVENPLQLSLRQALADLAVQFRISHQGQQQTTKKVLFEDVFSAARPILFDVSWSPRTVSAYVDGQLLRSASVSIDAADVCSGQVILADSTRQPDPWSGRVQGLAVYWTALSAGSIARHYRSWTNAGRPSITDEDYAAAIYTFSERSGRVIHNSVAGGSDLEIPATYTVVDKLFLEPFWDEFHHTRSYVKDVLINIFGFVPLGVCFCAFFELRRNLKRAGLLTVVIGFLVSLTIEVLQGYLPTRDSGTTDLITNTLGTFLGVAAYKVTWPKWAGVAATEGRSASQRRGVA